MKKILVGIKPSSWENITNESMILENGMDGSVGAMLTAYGMQQLLRTPEIEWISLAADHRFTSKEIEDINSNYDGLLLPLDQLFAGQMSEELVHLGKLVDALTIPCLISGVSFCEKHMEQEESGYYRQDVKTLLTAALKHSSKFGVIGGASPDFLKKMLFIKGWHYNVLSPAAMFAGNPVDAVCTPKEMNKNAKISIGCSLQDDPGLVRKLFAVVGEYSDCSFVPQSREDYILLYAGDRIANVPKSLSKIYPADQLHPIITEGREKAFIDVREWLEYIKSRDFYLGTDIRCVMAALAVGTRAVFLTSDQTDAKMANWYEVPYVMPGADEMLDIGSISRNWNAAGFYSSWKKRYNKEARFFKKNGYRVNETIDHVSKSKDGSVDKSLIPLLRCELEEQEKRINAYSMFLKEQVKLDKKQIEVYKKVGK